MKNYYCARLIDKDGTIIAISLIRDLSELDLYLQALQDNPFLTLTIKRSDLVITD